MLSLAFTLSFFCNLLKKSLISVFSHGIPLPGAGEVEQETERDGVTDRMMVRHSDNRLRQKREWLFHFRTHSRFASESRIDKKTPKPGSCWDPILVGAASAA